MRRLWLDDLREAPDGWEWARTTEECVTALRRGDVDEISLDHDLGLNPDAMEWANLNREGTGYDVISWLEQALELGVIKKVPVINIHSANPSGRQRMEMVKRRIENYRGRL